MRIEAKGLAVTVPPGWDSRIAQIARVDSVETAPALQLSNVPIPSSNDAFGFDAVDRLPPGGVYVNVADYSDVALPERYPNASVPVAFQAADFGPFEGFGTEAVVARTANVRGRILHFVVGIGGGRVVASAVAEANAALSSLDV